MRTGAGKGDAFRPVDRRKWEAGWERAFGKGKRKKRGKMPRCRQN